MYNINRDHWVPTICQTGNEEPGFCLPEAYNLIYQSNWPSGKDVCFPPAATYKCFKLLISAYDRVRWNYSYLPYYHKQREFTATPKWHGPEPESATQAPTAHAEASTLVAKRAAAVYIQTPKFSSILIAFIFTSTDFPPLPVSSISLSSYQFILPFWDRNIYHTYKLAFISFLFWSFSLCLPCYYCLGELYVYAVMAALIHSRLSTLRCAVSPQDEILALLCSLGYLLSVSYQNYERGKGSFHFFNLQRRPSHDLLQGQSTGEYRLRKKFQNLFSCVDCQHTTTSN